MTDVKPRIEQLKEQAKEIGLTHSPNIGPDTLAKKIKLFLANQDNQIAIQQHQIQQAAAVAPAAPVVEKVLTAEEALNLKRMASKKKATRLVRVIIECTNAAKASVQQGEMFQVGNSLVPTIKKYIPYGHPVHIEQILLSQAEEKVYQQRYGKYNEHTRNLKEFSITVLPDLTVAEVEDLKRMQAVRAEADKI